jgi:hypothetical protein
MILKNIETNKRVCQYLLEKLKFDAKVPSGNQKINLYSSQSVVFCKTRRFYNSIDLFNTDF